MQNATVVEAGILEGWVWLHASVGSRNAGRLGLAAPETRASRLHVTKDTRNNRCLPNWQVSNFDMKIVVFQVLQQDSSPHRFLTVATGFSLWGIRDAVDERASHIYSPSAGTSCPSSPSSSVSKREGWNSWRYYENSKWQDGDIEVSCSNCNDMVLFTESVDSVHSSYQSLVQTGVQICVLHKPFLHENHRH